MPFFFDFLQAAARINQPPQAVDFHTCGLRSVISNDMCVRKILLARKCGNCLPAASNFCAQRV